MNDKPNEPLPVRDPGATFRKPAATVQAPPPPAWDDQTPHAWHAFGDDKDTK